MHIFSIIFFLFADLSNPRQFYDTHAMDGRTSKDNFFKIIDKPYDNWRDKLEALYGLKSQQLCSSFMKPVEVKIQIEEVKPKKRPFARRKSIWSKKREKISFQTRRLSVAQLTTPGRKSLSPAMMMSRRNTLWEISSISSNSSIRQNNNKTTSFLPRIESPRSIQSTPPLTRVN